MGSTLGTAPSEALVMDGSKVVRAVFEQVELQASTPLPRTPLPTSAPTPSPTSALGPTVTPIVVVKEVIVEVPKEVVVIKEVPVEVIVEKEVIKEVIREVVHSYNRGRTKSDAYHSACAHSCPGARSNSCSHGNHYAHINTYTGRETQSHPSTFWPSIQSCLESKG